MILLLENVLLHAKQHTTLLFTTMFALTFATMVAEIIPAHKKRSSSRA
jgi:hypothetical protein